MTQDLRLCYTALDLVITFCFYCTPLEPDSFGGIHYKNKGQLVTQSCEIEFQFWNTRTKQITMGTENTEYLCHIVSVFISKIDHVSKDCINYKLCFQRSLMKTSRIFEFTINYKLTN